jgi:hypothetical protein
MIEVKAPFRKIAVLEMIGFLTVLGIILADEIFDLPHLLLGATMSPARLEEYLIEGISVLCLAAGVLYFSHYAARKIGELEAFLVMCAWCRRVKINGRWVPIEEYLKIKDELRTTHGICHECANEMRQAMQRKPTT